MKLHRAYIDLPHGQVHYASFGQRSQDAVLLLHQTPRSWAEYRHVLPILGQHFWTIAMDTPGFGASDPTEDAPSIEAWAAVAAQLLQALGLQSAHVVGHHTGGVIALELAAQHADKVRSVVLCSTPYTDEEFRHRRAKQPPIDAVEPREDGEHLAQLWRKRQAFYPQGRPDLLQAFVLDALKVVGDVEGGHRAVASYRMEDRVAKVSQRALVIRATQDPFASPDAERWRSELPSAQQVDIEGGMAPLPDQKPDEFAAAVLNFLKGKL